MAIQLEKRGAEYLVGISDVHISAAPSVYTERAFTELELATQARDVGYRGLLFKDHHTINADRTQYVRALVPGIAVHGGVVLNHPVGGLNPSAVEAAINFGAKCVWMPSLHSAGHEAHYGSVEYRDLTLKFQGKKLPLKGITILDSEKRILPEVFNILELVRDADIILGTGHLTTEEVFSLVRAAHDLGITKLLVQHVEIAVTKRSLDEQIQLAEMGAVLEHTFNAVFYQHAKVDEIALAIKKHGAERGVLATDCGNIFTPHPIEAMRLFIMMLMQNGIPKEGISLLTRKIPADLLGIE
jgi:hypothetical protein